MPMWTTMNPLWKGMQSLSKHIQIGRPRLSLRLHRRRRQNRTRLITSKSFCYEVTYGGFPQYGSRLIPL